MIILSKCVVGFVVLQHIGFLVLEMFLWTHPIGLKIFRQTLEQAEKSKVLAANQGLYNGFLAAGLFWSLIHSQPEASRQISIFFLGCILVAGIFGGITASARILLIQAGPALLGLALLFFAKSA
jgi:putative membrane protein